MIPRMLRIERAPGNDRVQLTVKSGDYSIFVMLRPAEAVAVIAELATLTAAIVHELGAGDREDMLRALNETRARHGLPPRDSLDPP
jgi:hypothetical protein